jgi:hypothetical protein
MSRYGALGYEAFVMVSDAEDRVKVSPVLIVLDAVSCALHRNVPEEAASQKDTCETTSPFVPAQDVHEGVVEEFSTPVVGVVNVIDGRVVTEETEVVPAAPGLAVCSWT